MGVGKFFWHQPRWPRVKVTKLPKRDAIYLVLIPDDLGKPGMILEHATTSAIQGSPWTSEKPGTNWDFPGIPGTGISRDYLGHGTGKIPCSPRLPGTTWDIKPGTWDLPGTGTTWDFKPETLNQRPGTTWDFKPETWDLKLETWAVLEIQSKKL